MNRVLVWSRLFGFLSKEPYLCDFVTPPPPPPPKKKKKEKRSFNDGLYPNIYDWFFPTLYDEKATKFYMFISV